MAAQYGGRLVDDKHLWRSRFSTDVSLNCDRSKGLRPGTVLLVDDGYDDESMLLDGR